MAMFLSCSHESDSFEDVINISIMDVDLDYEKPGWINVIRHMCVCKECYKKYESWGIILKTEQEQQDWLDGKLEYPEFQH